MTQRKSKKGSQMEETLRYFFIDLGYFVVRGVKFSYQGLNVTDIDLWLYMRPSSLTRERTNVDAKNKRTPQAIERIFWAKGLQQVLGFENCIVATTDKRKAVSDFGKQHDVSVLDGNFYNRLISRYGNLRDRLTEEEFLALMNPDGLGKLRGNWRTRVETAKAGLLTQLNYSGCNSWLNDIAFFMEQSIVDYHRKEIACRISYLIISFLLIGIDYVLKDLAFQDKETKATDLREGFQHGELGKTGTDKILSTSIALIEGYLHNGKQLAMTLRRSVSEAYEQIPANILKEFFNRPDVARNLFDNARKFELLAYQRNFVSPLDIDAELKAIVGVVLDFSKINRRKFYDNFQNPTDRDIKVSPLPKP